MSKLDELLAKAEDYKKNMQEQGEAAIKELLQEFFKEHPVIIGIHWKQYIPYFNDGEPCYFNVREADFAFEEPKKFVMMDSVEESNDIDSQGNHYYDAYMMKSGPIKNACERLAETLCKVEDVLEFAFGEHAEVYATPDSIKVEEYTSHD